MSAIDWVVVPSTWWEIFGLVVSEAWMFGRPIIASAIAGLKERVMADVNGFTFPARDSRALAELMVTLIDDENRWINVNESLEQPWTEVEMLDAHFSVWNEFAEKKRATSRKGMPAPILEKNREAKVLKQTQDRKISKRIVVGLSSE